jgi:sugar-specific transcriptional regulator TrmB
MEKKKLKQILESFNFTKAEVDVYFTILKLGESKVGEIIKNSGISSSNTHDCLEKLIKKGIISFILKNNVKHFYPTKPENLKILIKEEQDKLKEKEEILESIIPELNSFPKQDAISQGAEIFIGVNGIKNAYKKFTDPIIENTESFFFQKVDKKTIKRIHDFYTKLEMNEEYKHIKQKGIASKEYKKYIDKRKNSPIKMKYTNLPIPSYINTYGDKTLFISWTKNPIAFLIKSEEITKTFKDLFQEIWAKTK